jgi:hypothetical protein
MANVTHKTTMGIDQYGTTYHDLGPHPRKTLLERLGRKHAARMYMEYRTGPDKVRGYIIAERWITLYSVTPWEPQS